MHLVPVLQEVPLFFNIIPLLFHMQALQTQPHAFRSLRENDGHTGGPAWPSIHSETHLEPFAALQSRGCISLHSGK
jgi:hypothetical protein